MIMIKKYLKIEFNSYHQLPVHKAIETPSMIKVVRAVFQENGKFYPQLFVDEYLYKLKT